MMESQIFYYTGKAIWLVVCFGCIFSAVACAIIAPIIAAIRIKKLLWQWRWAAEIAHTGFTQEDVQFAMYGKTPRDIPMEELLAWVAHVKQRGDDNNKLFKWWQKK